MLPGDRSRQRVSSLLVDECTAGSGAGVMIFSWECVAPGGMGAGFLARRFGRGLGVALLVLGLQQRTILTQTSHLRDLDTNNRITEEDQSRGNEMLPPPFAHFIQGPHHKLNSVHKNTNSHRSLQRSINNCEKKEVTMVWTCDQIKWPLQKGSTRHSTREKKRGKTKEKMGRQHQRVDRSRLQQQSESSLGPSEMAEDCRRCQQWCPYDPDSFQDTGNR